MEISMSMIDQIDFLNHDGVNRAMINDFMRNQFYDNIFAETVKDQHCVDIGFGTGLLSILALKHGARSVTAYESDPARFELGQLIIQTLNLNKLHYFMTDTIIPC
jgi:predicted RNA methylase